MTKKFSLENVLNVTATEYVASQERELSDYEMKGIIVVAGVGMNESPEETLRKLIPPRTEVVVNYQQSISMTKGLFTKGIAYLGYGTALIPKRKND